MCGPSAAAAQSGQPQPSPCAAVSTSWAGGAVSFGPTVFSGPTIVPGDWASAAAGTPGGPRGDNGAMPGTRGAVGPAIATLPNGAPVGDGASAPASPSSASFSGPSGPGGRSGKT